ncbi:MAG: hypothetical protein LBO66_09250 [Deltaproteobacteria bacterium]|nr:hypothetical protein [Deltaproteobacteria bacterium]
MLAPKSPILLDAIERLKELNLNPRTVKKAARQSRLEAGYQAELKREKAEGRAEGGRKKALKVAIKLLWAQSTLDFVAKISGLSSDEVRALATRVNAKRRA